MPEPRPTADAFIAKWKAWNGHERQGYQEHFRDLCALLDQPAPHDPTTYCFEKGVTKTSGGRGWADVWKRGHFAVEYKAKGAALEAALAQLQQYALALENPPLLIVCDFERWLIVSNFTNAVSERRLVRLEELRDPATLDVLRRLFTDPESFRPARTRQQVTEEVACEVGEIATALRARGHDPQHVAHLVIRLVFCMFAEAIGLLPDKLLTRTLDNAVRHPDRAQQLLSGLFRAMRDGSETFGPFVVPWFDGGLFDDDSTLPLPEPLLRALRKAADRDWAELDPSIMGTLFERGLDPDKRGQLGKFYTDRDKIELIVDPVIRRPLQREWQEVRSKIAALVEEASGVRGARSAKLRAEARALYEGHLERLRRFRVLDPACGSGNFLNLALQALKDLEWQMLIEAEELGLGQELRSSQVSPRQMFGIEINEFAVELARASVWIADIQWLRRRGLGIDRRPILEKLETIECRDALLNPDGTEAAWPEAEAIIGNPPFLGGKLLRKGLGDALVDRLFERCDGRVPREADLVCYWLAKAGAALAAGSAERVGLVATNSIRGGANRKVLDRIAADAVIYEAWSDEPWVQEGAAVRVSILCFARRDDPVANGPRLDGRSVPAILTDLSARGADLTKAARLVENAGLAFQGLKKVGPFDISGDLARNWLSLPMNVNRRTNKDVLRPLWNGVDLIRRPRDRWIVEFFGLSENEAAEYEAPFQYVLHHVKPLRVTNRDRQRRERWWQLGRSGAGLKAALEKTKFYLATPEVAKFRCFRKLLSVIAPDSQLIVIARDDDTSFGILHSRFHELWSLRLGTSLEDRPRYTPTTTFETFPFPEGLTPNLPASAYAADPRARAIAEAARALHEKREAWLNPPDLVRRVPEVVPGYPDRLLPIDEKAAAELKKRTLTRLYNERPQWLRDLHRALDEAVAAAYGWPADLPEEEVLARLLALNRERARAGR
ncbi:MAG: N-6 DNA methylase [Geminicoccaceae bacterium]|nr:N-6 DNA methylase [Geminicoccaceae bacterium]